MAADAERSGFSVQWLAFDTRATGSSSAWAPRPGEVAPTGKRHASLPPSIFPPIAGCSGSGHWLRSSRHGEAKGAPHTHAFEATSTIVFGSNGSAVKDADASGVSQSGPGSWFGSERPIALVASLMVDTDPAHGPDYYHPGW